MEDIIHDGMQDCRKNRDLGHESNLLGGLPFEKKHHVRAFGIIYGWASDINIGAADIVPVLGWLYIF